MTYLLFQAAMVLGLLGAVCLDSALAAARSTERSRLVTIPAAAAVISLAVPGAGQLVAGRPLTGLYLMGALIAVLAAVPLPLSLVSLPWSLVLGPLWGVGVVHAWIAARP